MVQPVWLEEERPIVAPPPGLAKLLTSFAAAALKEQPADLVEFGVAFFAALKEQRQAEAALASSPPLRVIISGAPASGKGTQAARVVAELGLVHVSVGDLLRAEVAAGTELGQQAKEFMNAGALVPDELVVSLVSTRLGQQDALEAGWLLDGFPRTAAQCEALAAAGGQPDLFLSIEVPDAVLVDRVAGRRLDPETGEIYHLTFKPPPPEIAGRLVQRADDTEETVRTRLITYKAHAEAVKTSPALGLHRQGKLQAVDGDRPEAAVWEDVRAALLAARRGAGAARE